MSDGQMRALTLWQPWAWAVARGIKNVENRPWAPPSWLVGQRFAIHAGMKYDMASYEAVVYGLYSSDPEPPEKNSAVLGAIVATTILVGVATTETQVDLWRIDESRWFFGPYGWLLDDTVLLDTPIPCRGYQKLWKVPRELMGGLL